MKQGANLIESFVPCIRELVKREKDHLLSLQRKRRFLVDKRMIDTCTERSKQRLDFYEMRLRQYIDYANSSQDAN